MVKSTSARPKRTTFKRQDSNFEWDSPNISSTPTKRARKEPLKCPQANQTCSNKRGWRPSSTSAEEEPSLPKKRGRRPVSIKKPSRRPPSTSTGDSETSRSQKRGRRPAGISAGDDKLRHPKKRDRRPSSTSTDEEESRHPKKRSRRPAGISADDRRPSPPKKKGRRHSSTSANEAEASHPKKQSRRPAFTSADDKKPSHPEKGDRRSSSTSADEAESSRPKKRGQRQPSDDFGDFESLQIHFDKPQEDDDIPSSDGSMGGANGTINDEISVQHSPPKRQSVEFDGSDNEHEILRFDDVEERDNPQDNL